MSRLLPAVNVVLAITMLRIGLLPYEPYRSTFFTFRN